ncbi:hypothetical protein ACFFRR_000996 [Megaselia abdita]
MFNHIQHNLNDIKHKQVLKAHQVSHQLSISSLSLVSLFGLMSLVAPVYLIYKKIIRTSKPIPKPRSVSYIGTSKSIDRDAEAAVQKQHDYLEHPLDEFQFS